MQNDKDFKDIFPWNEALSSKFDAIFEQGVWWSRPKSENQFGYHKGQDVVRASLLVPSPPRIMFKDYTTYNNFFFKDNKICLPLGITHNRSKLANQMGHSASLDCCAWMLIDYMSEIGRCRSLLLKRECSYSYS